LNDGKWWEKTHNDGLKTSEKQGVGTGETEI
jgi:hypothetical protein